MGRRREEGTYRIPANLGKKRVSKLATWSVRSFKGTGGNYRVLIFDTVKLIVYCLFLPFLQHSDSVSLFAGRGRTQKPKRRIVPPVHPNFPVTLSRSRWTRMNC
jgi:hypothetical protein